MRIKLIMFCLLLLVIQTSFADNKKEVLTVHNQFRALHLAPNVVWDETLAKYAENHAKKCVFRHSGSPYGENLAAGYPTITAAIQGWYGEGKQYDFDHPGFSMKTGHFTQVVWKGSKKVGCSFVSCEGENGTPGKFLVCEYLPAGNVTNSGYFEANVLQVKS